MTERLYLHVGSPKAGSSYLQAVLRANQQRLADAGVLVVGERWLDLVHAGMVVRDDPRLEQAGSGARDAWQRLVAQVRGWDGPSAVLSYELLAGAEEEQARRALADLAGIEVHLVVTARDFGRALPSAWQERTKYAQSNPLEGWRAKGEAAGPRVEWGWRTMDPALVTARWAVDLPPERVHVVTLPRSGAPADELWRRFAEACGLDHLELDLDVPRVNESLAPGPAELLRRVNEALDGRISSPGEVSRWVRDTLANDVLVPLGEGSLGITDEQLEAVTKRSNVTIGKLRTRGYQVHGDLEELRASRPDGGLPGDVPDTELLDLAVRALADLLVQLRDREAGTKAPVSAPRAEARPVGRLRESLRRRLSALRGGTRSG